jgi:hypothetical protein
VDDLNVEVMLKQDGYILEIKLMDHASIQWLNHLVFNNAEVFINNIIIYN